MAGIGERLACPFLATQPFSPNGQLSVVGNKLFLIWAVAMVRGLGGAISVSGR